jgi:hypothetical protein
LARCPAVRSGEVPAGDAARHLVARPMLHDQLTAGAGRRLTVVAGSAAVTAIRAVDGESDHPVGLMREPRLRRSGETVRAAMPLAGGCLMRSVSGRRQMKGSTHHRGGQIVVGVDGTAARAAAIRWAVREARLRRARVHLVFLSSPEITDSAAARRMPPWVRRVRLGTVPPGRCWVPRSRRRTRPCRWAAGQLNEPTDRRLRC